MRNLFVFVIIVFYDINLIDKDISSKSFYIKSIFLFCERGRHPLL